MRDDGFTEFVAAQMPALLRIARTLTGNPHDAADLVQDCLVRVGSRWSSVRVGQNPAGYARVVLVRLNIDRMRRIRRRLNIERRAADPEYRDEPALGVEPWLLAAWRELTPSQRTALALHYLEDLDAGEIAALMSCAPGTVRSHISRGLASLRAYADQPVGGGLR
jgi:RNA polymerase sigma-70 factor (sigma-E family)